MMPYRSIPEAEAALRRNLTSAEAAWLGYSAGMHDFWLHCHTIVFILIIYSLVPLPLAILELTRPGAIRRYKLQPGVLVPYSAVFRCYKYGLQCLVFGVAPVQMLSYYPTAKLVGWRTGLPLPGWCDVAAQVAVYLLVEDYANYWVHRALHTRWGYEKIHRVHHEFTAPVGFVALHIHPLDQLLSVVPIFLGPAFVPCHILTFWLWVILRLLGAIETHCGYDFPWNPTKLIPFYGGAEYHDYHHFVGGRSRSNFAIIFTYCDYIYGTNKGYRYYRQHKKGTE